MSKNYDLSAVKTQIEESPYDWTAGETSLTRMSEADRDLRLGVPLPPAAELAAMVRAAERGHVEEAVLAASDTAAVPTAFNLNDTGGQSYVAGVRNQLGCGSCVAFGVVATLEGTARYTRRLPGLDIDLSEAHLFYGWGRSVGRTCANGWLPLEATQFCTNRGVTYSLRMPGATALRVLTFSLDAAGEGTLVVILKRGWEPEPLRTTSWSVVVEAERAEPSEDADDVEQTEA